MYVGPISCLLLFFYTFVYNNIKKPLCFYFLVLASYCKKRLLWCQYWPHWGRKENHIGTQDKVSISHKSRSSGYIRLAISFFFFTKAIIYIDLCKIIRFHISFFMLSVIISIKQQKKKKFYNEMTFNSRMCLSWTA